MSAAETKTPWPVRCWKPSQSHENEGPAWAEVAARTIMRTAKTSRMPTSMTDMIHCARAVTCTPNSTHAAITRNQSAPTPVISGDVLRLVGREQRDRHRTGGQRARDHEDGRRDDERPSGQEAEDGVQRPRDPRVGGARVHIQPPEVEERPRDAEHRDAAPEQCGGGTECGGADERRRRGRDRVGRRAARDGHDDRAGGADAVRFERVIALPPVCSVPPCGASGRELVCVIALPGCEGRGCGGAGGATPVCDRGTLATSARAGQVCDDGFGCRSAGGSP